MAANRSGQSPALPPPSARAYLRLLMSESVGQRWVLKDMNSRITFGAELRYAMHVRGLSLTDVARHSGVAVATASSAAMGRPVNVTTTLRVARAVAARPIIPELLEWVERPHPSDVGLNRGHRSAQPSPSGATSTLPPFANERVGSHRPRRPAPSTPGQLRIAMD
jgi:transcriptional regulator with XRE-family HTH domain